MSAREQVDGLAELVGWTGSGSAGIDWEALHRSLGLPVPEDFKELIRRYMDEKYTPEWRNEEGDAARRRKLSAVRLRSGSLETRV